jgi:hypothetical protein
MTIRRLKTYAGSQGYVYQYYFVGKRRAADATVFTFDVTRDRKLTQPVNILLPGSVVLGWGELHDRPLSDSEQYAAVKLRLFQAFDEIADLLADNRPLQIDGAFLEESMASLGVE